MFVKIALLLVFFAFSAFSETLEERVEKLEDKVNAPQLRSNLFNPGLTVFGNFLGCVGPGCKTPFTLREIELDLRASIDPWADGVAIIAFEPEHGHVEIEEGYVVIKKLPILDDAPWGLSLKIGHYLAPFGRFNQIHLHDLPQITAPASVSAFLGGHGLARDGLSAEFFIPTPGDNNSLRLNLNLINGGGLPFNKPFSKELRPVYPAGLVHTAWFWDLAPEHDLEVGLSAYLENNPLANTQLIQLYGTDLNYKWRPYRQGEKRSFLLGGELFVANGIQCKNNYWPLGGFVWTQYQINQWLYPGVRYSYYQGVKHDNPNHSVGAFLTYYTTEFLRLRAGYEWDNHHQSQVLLELNFVMGSHPVEPYWVNR